MTYTEIQVALESHMAQWAGGVPIWFDGIPIPPHVKAARDGEPRGPWIRFVINTSRAFTAGIGQNPCRRVPGTITAEIYYPRVASGGTGVGVNPAYACSQLADELVEHFQYWQSGKLSTQATSNVYVEPEDDWYRRNVVTDFDAD
jgi:hypothetical protein